jgi:hypothetical protein
MAVQYIDWRVSSAQGALPAQIVVERWFTAGAYAAASSNTPAYPPAVIHWNCLLRAPWAPWASLKSISSRSVKGLR